MTSVLQAFLFCASLVGIGTIFLMIVGAVEVSLGEISTN